MKKKYESPMAEKYEFNYVENVVASGLVVEGGTNTEEGKNNINACFTGNKSNKSASGNNCGGKQK